MFLTELNEKLSEFVNDPRFKKIIQNIDSIEKICYKCLEKNIVINNNTYSKKIKLEETLKIIYQFLLTINKDLATQFINMIHNVDENGEPIFVFKPAKEEQFPINCILKNGKVKIYYTDTIDDIFAIIHEFFHLSNDSKIEDEYGNVSHNEYRDDYSETVSITAEYLLGQYLVYNKIITKNDFYKRKKFRYENAIYCAQNALVQCKLIRRYVALKNIDDKYYNIILKSDSDRRAVESIVYGIGMNLPLLLKYVRGELYADEILQSTHAIDDFVKLNYTIGNINCSYEDISKALPR